MSRSSSTLRARLLRRLWWPLLVVLLVSAGYDYSSALGRARTNQDIGLGRIAIALTSAFLVLAYAMTDLPVWFGLN